jgi:hypothetical protein
MWRKTIAISLKAPVLPENILIIRQSVENNDAKNHDQQAYCDDDQ